MSPSSDAVMDGTLGRSEPDTKMPTHLGWGDGWKFPKGQLGQKRIGTAVTVTQQYPIKLNLGSREWGCMPKDSQSKYNIENCVKCCLSIDVFRFVELDTPVFIQGKHITTVSPNQGGWAMVQCYRVVKSCLSNISVSIIVKCTGPAGVGLEYI